MEPASNTTARLSVGPVSVRSEEIWAKEGLPGFQGHRIDTVGSTFDCQHKVSTVATVGKFTARLVFNAADIAWSF